VTVLAAVSTQFIMMLASPAMSRHDLSSLQVAVHAGAPCPPDVKDAMIAWWGLILVEYYSATEGHGMTAMTSAEW